MVIALSFPRSCVGMQFQDTPHNSYNERKIS
jgi:hypothetical protein